MSRLHSPLVPDYDNEIVGIAGCLLFGAVVVLAAVVGVGFGLWLLASRAWAAIEGAL